MSQVLTCCRLLEERRQLVVVTYVQPRALLGSQLKASAVAGCGKTLVAAYLPLVKPVVPSRPRFFPLATSLCVKCADVGTSLRSQFAVRSTLVRFDGSYVFTHRERKISWRPVDCTERFIKTVLSFVKVPAAEKLQ